MVDPLERRRCHAEMEIVSFINEGKVIEKISGILIYGLWSKWLPGYEESYITWQ